MIPHFGRGHVLRVADQAACLLEHDVATQRVADAVTLAECVVAEDDALDVVLIIVVLDCPVGVLGRVIDTVGAVHLLDAGVIVVEGVLAGGVQPRREVYSRRIIAECAPALIHIGVLVIDIVGVEPLGLRIDIIDVAIRVAAVSLEHPQWYAARDVEQLVDLAALAELRAVLGLGAAERHLGVHAEEFVHLHASLEVEVDLVERLAVEEALAVHISQRCAEVRRVGRLAYRHVVCLGEAGVEVFLEFVPVVTVGVLLSAIQPAVYHPAVHRRTEGLKRAGVVLPHIRACAERCALSVGGLLVERRCHVGPCEVARVGHAESFVLDTFFGRDEDDAITGA